MQKQTQTAPFIMQANEKGASKVVQSTYLTADLFVTFSFTPTAAQVKKKIPLCSLRMVIDKRSRTVLTSRFVDLKALNRFVKDAEKLNQKKGGKMK